jgi:hypothetical protein
MSATTEQLEARGHHTISPSTLQNREACPCYESRNEQHVRAIAGTLAHAAVEKREDNPELSDEDAAAAAECLDFIDTRRRDMEAWRFGRVEGAGILAQSQGRPRPPADPEIIELREQLLPVDDCKFEDCESTTAGYVDHIIIDQAGRYAEMIDYKFGVWPVEDAPLNLQGIAYVLGVFKKFQMVDTVRFFFKQPLIDSLSEAVFTRDQIPMLYLRVQTVVARTREARARIAKDDWSMARPMVPACNFCNNLGRCPKVLEMALKVGQKFHPLEVPEALDPTGVLAPHQVNLCLRLAQVVKIWAEAFRSQTTNRVLEGRASLPDGYKLVSQSRRQLVDKEKFRETAMRYLTEREFSDTLDVLFGAVEKAIMDKAPRGSKKQSIEQFKEELHAVGATVDGQPFTFLKATASKEKTNEPQKE